MSHTPGPWKVHDSYLEGYPGKRQAIYTSEMEYVAICDAVLAGSADDQKNEANARLIASAPTLKAVNAQLLEALEELEEVFSDLLKRSPNLFGYGDAISSGAISRTREAIKLAKGE